MRETPEIRPFQAMEVSQVKLNVRAIEGEPRLQARFCTSARLKYAPPLGETGCQNPAHRRHSGLQGGQIAVPLRRASVPLRRADLLPTRPHVAADRLCRSLLIHKRR